MGAPCQEASRSWQTSLNSSRVLLHLPKLNLRDCLKRVAPIFSPNQFLSVLCCAAACAAVPGWWREQHGVESRGRSAGLYLWLCLIYVGSLSSPGILKYGEEGKKLRIWDWSDPGSGQLLCCVPRWFLLSPVPLLFGLAPVSPLTSNWARLHLTWETSVWSAGKVRDGGTQLQ